MLDNIAQYIGYIVITGVLLIVAVGIGAYITEWAPKSKPGRTVHSVVYGIPALLVTAIAAMGLVVTPFLLVYFLIVDGRYISAGITALILAFIIYFITAINREAILNKLGWRKKSE